MKILDKIIKKRHPLSEAQKSGDDAKFCRLFLETDIFVISDDIGEGLPVDASPLEIKEQMEKDPKKVIQWAVKNMLPKNKLRDRRMRRLKIFSGSEHKYEDKFKNPN